MITRIANQTVYKERWREKKKKKKKTFHSFIQDDYMVNANCGHSAKTINMFGLKMCTN